MKKWIWVLVLIIVALVIVGVSKNKSPNGTIKIGVLLPLSGPVAYIGENMQKGFESALKEINSKSKKFELIYEDNKNSPADAVTGAKKLVELDNVDILITTMSGSSVAVASYMKSNNRKIPLIATGVYADIPGTYADTFQMYISVESEGDALKKWVDIVKPKKLGVLYANNEMGVQLNNMMVSKSGLPALDVYSESFEQTSKTFRTELLKLKSAGVDTIYITLLSSPEVIVKEAREIGFTGNLISPSVLYLNGLISSGKFDGIYTSAPASYLNLDSIPMGNIEICSEVLYLLDRVIQKESLENLVDSIVNEKNLVTRTLGTLVIDPAKKTVYFPIEIGKIQSGRLIKVN